MRKQLPRRITDAIQPRFDMPIVIRHQNYTAAELDEMTANLNVLEGMPKVIRFEPVDGESI